MRELRQYKIDIFGLKNGNHQFEFEFNDEFFSNFENSLMNKGKGTCNVDLMKSSSMIQLTLNIGGFIELICDRSLEAFDYKLDVKQELIFKYGDEEKELSENMFVILKDTQSINIGNFLYEFISIEIPMKKLHPKFQDDNSADELIYTSKEDINEEEGTDPRWEALKKLK